MKHSNISIFVPHVGCPHLCAFCDQRTISGTQKAPTPQQVRDICEKALAEISSPGNTEIAFFGGSFTAIDRKYMVSLLEAAHDLVGDDGFAGIRLSTRPDYIDDDILSLLKEYGVTSIELGAQSLDDNVLAANERGHTAQDIVDASQLIKSYGFELGLQLMVGLYKTTEDTEFCNMRKVIELAPSTVRIYPVVILKGTVLADLLASGEYVPMSMDSVIRISSVMLESFENSGIRVIKCGLHASEFVERDMVGGFYHPAFREMCESEIFKNKFISLLEESGITLNDKSSKELTAVFGVSPKCISKAYGHKKSNASFFKENGVNIKIKENRELHGYMCELKEVSMCT